MKNLKFDWTAEQFILDGNSPLVVEGQQADKSWTEQFVHVERGLHKIYPDTYGISKYDVFRYRLPAAAAMSELNRQIQDMSKYNSRIKYITNVSLNDDNEVEFDLQLKDY